MEKACPSPPGPGVSVKWAFLDVSVNRLSPGHGRLHRESALDLHPSDPQVDPQVDPLVAPQATEEGPAAATAPRAEGGRGPPTGLPAPVPSKALERRRAGTAFSLERQPVPWAPRRPRALSRGPRLPFPPVTSGCAYSAATRD